MFDKGLPIDWISCRMTGISLTTPSKIRAEPDNVPYDGDSYLSMRITDGEQTQEVSQMLNTPLISGEGYNFSVYLSSSRYEEYALPRQQEGAPNNGYFVKRIFSKERCESVRFKIWGGNNDCNKKELLAETNFIDHTEWKEYVFRLAPSDDYSFIILEAFNEFVILEGFGDSSDSKGYINLLIDNCSDISPVLWDDIKLEFQQLHSRVSDNERIKYLSIRNKKLNKYYSFAVKYNGKQAVQNATNLLLNTKGIIFDSRISIKDLIQKSDDKELIKLGKELRTIEDDIANAEMMSLAERINNPDGLIEIHPMYAYRDSLTSKIRKNVNLRDITNRTSFEWQEVHDKLKENEMSIDFVRFNDTVNNIPMYIYCAAVINKNLPNPQFIYLGDEENISSLLQTNNTGQPEYIKNISHRKELHKKIWQPLLPYLKGITTIHISPAGLLHRVSFEALQDEERKYLGEQFQFHYYSSMRDFINKKATPASYKDAILMGNILYDTEDTLEYQPEEWYTMRNNRDKVRRLEATLEEVIDIRKTCESTGVESKVFTFNKATEDTIQYFSGEHAPSILHLATHGLFLEPIDIPKTGGTVEERLRSLTNPLQRSVLMLYGANHRWEKNESVIGTDEDGILTALEVTALDLRKTDLVVLSACSTALGEVQHNTEGVFGLQRAFKLAGVRHVVASLWDVDDAATKDLMVKFYKNLLQHKQDPATALRTAKDELREAGYEPQDWAGFILIE